MIEIKSCQQLDSCEAIISECSQSKWNFGVGSSARFKVHSLSLFKLFLDLTQGQLSIPTGYTCSNIPF